MNWQGKAGWLVFLAACGAAPEAIPARACPARDVAVRVDAEAALLSACRELSGLEVGPSFSLHSLAGLARLERVAGGIDVSDNVELGGLFLPALVAVGGDLLIDDNRQVATASLHHLVEVGGDLVVRGNRALVRLDLGALRRVGGRLEVSGHPHLETVVLDRLDSAAELVLEDNPAWPTDEVEAVRRRLQPRSASGAARGHRAARERATATRQRVGAIGCRP